MWNKFLLSPLEFARYVDEFESPWIRAYFDIGNVAISAYPQDWIRTLGKRIVKLHVKDFSFKKRVAEFTPLLEGEIDWRAVHAALADIGYQGTATVELTGGDAAYLKEVSRRFDRILDGTPQLCTYSDRRFDNRVIVRSWVAVKNFRAYPLFSITSGFVS